MRGLTLKTCFLFFFVTSYSFFSFAVQCSDFVNQREANDLVVHTDFTLPGIARAGILNSPIALLIEAEILYSPVFREALVRAMTVIFKSNNAGGERTKARAFENLILDTPERALAQYSDSLRLKLIENMYEVMGEILTTTDGRVSLSTRMKNANTSFEFRNTQYTRDVFSMLPKTVVLDKMGEALIEVQKRGKFPLSTQNSWNDLIEYSTPSASLLATIMGVAGVVRYNLDPLSTELILFWGGAIGSGATFVFRDFVSKTLGTLPLILRHRRTPWMIGRDQRRDFQDQSILLKGDFQHLSKRLRRISTDTSDVYQGVRGRSVEVGQLTGFASRALNLQREFVGVFITDFFKWVRVYEVHKSRIKKRLRNVKDELIDPVGSEADSLKFLADVYRQALEASKEVTRVSEEIRQLLVEELRRLETLDVDSAEFRHQQSYGARSKLLRDALEGHEYFLEFLKRFDEQAQQVNLAVDSVAVAETIGMVTTLGKALYPGVQRNRGVDELLAELDKMDVLIAKIIIKEPPSKWKRRILKAWDLLPDRWETKVRKRGLDPRKYPLGSNLPPTTEKPGLSEWRGEGVVIEGGSTQGGARFRRGALSGSKSRRVGF